MSDQNNTDNKRKPDSIAYSVQQNNDGKAYWNKVGAAWQHKDKQGYDIQRQSIPVDGHITLREQRDEQIKSHDNQRQASQNQGQQQTQTLSQNRGQTR